MSSFAVVVFWVSVGLVAYTYLIYPLVLFVLHLGKNAIQSTRFLLHRERRRVSDRLTPSPDMLPHVSLLLAAHNEEEMLAKKIKNFQELAYPADKIELLIGSDSSDDATVSIARSAGDSRVRVFDYQERSGKIGVLNKLRPEANGSILVLSDTNTFFEPEAVLNLVRHFSDHGTGAVCGELHLAAPDGTLKSEGLYWRYETIIKTLESGFGAVLGANGGNYAVRAELYPEIPADTIIEDFVIPLKIRERGFRTPFDAEALATERNPVDPKGEFRRRARIGAGCAQSLPMIAPLVSPRFGMLAFALFSHKIVRWAVPFFLLIAFVSNLWLLDRPFYLVLWVLQLLFYGTAIVGWRRDRAQRPMGVAALPYMFVILNAALAVGYVNFVRRTHRVTWERTQRVEIE